MLRIKMELSSITQRTINQYISRFLTQLSFLRGQKVELHQEFQLPLLTELNKFENRHFIRLTVNPSCGADAF